MIQLSDIISRIRTKHEQATNVRWTDANIQGIINEGLESLAESTHFYERYTTIPMAVSRHWYDLRGFVPETVVRIRSVYNTNRTEWLRPGAVENLPYDWLLSVGEPQVYFTRGIHWLGVWPKPGNGNAGFLRVYFSAIPAHFTFTQAVLRDLPDNHIPALEDYALYEMAAQDRQGARAKTLYRSYLAREKGLQDFIDRRMVDSTAGVMSGMMGPNQ